MKLNEIFKAINLRVKISKPYSKNFYGENCREFTFEDCYGNDVGTFVIHPEGDVCQVIVNSISKDSSLCSVVYRWINPLSIALREHLLSQKAPCEKLRETYVFNNIPYKQILKSDTILEIVSSTCNGEVFLFNELNNEVHNNIFNSKENNTNLNFRTNMNSIKQDAVKYTSYNVPNMPTNIHSLKNKDEDLKNMLTGSGVKRYVENKVTEDFSLSEKIPEVSLFKEDLILEQSNIDKDNLLSIAESLNVKFPECIDGSFMIGKGFIPQRLNNNRVLTALVSDSDLESKKVVDKIMKPGYGNLNKSNLNKSNIGLSKSILGDDSKMTLRERVFCSINPVNLSDGLKKNIYRYPGEKTVLSNLKPIG